MAGKDNETLREKAAKKLHGPGANPSQLGDPISLKSETSERIPKPEEAGAHGQKDGNNKDGSPYAPPVAPPPPTHDANWDSNTPSKQRELENKKKLEDNKAGGSGGKAAKKGGDPASLKKEISQKAPTPTEEGASPGAKKGRESKL
ncbi:uncharacterized protein B0I36DRAFT_316632 [Microdochium trichocladiopsis]|uniref:Uncharacterized protein n=1 Tax=Microdochium trichocladiopsis TaxID=1682393 RepID=A0A9P8YAS4_9PEZI|nr:uncharacterized protein B0I36DRAFT_316632 [Microdochium trichocladiopsis]KAH7034614.1 hypothetical protein B0I36DRAFT_316632 [Microdochium trichocladiopsis]